MIGELVVSDVEPTTFMRAIHPHRGEDGVHRRVPHVEATTVLVLLALPWFLGRSTRQSVQARCPPLHYRNQSNNTSIKKPAPCSISQETRCIRTSYTGGIKGRRHKVQWSTVRSMETLVSSLVGSYSVCMISPSS